MSHRCPSLPSTGSGVFSEFQLTLMTARFDGLESIIGWRVPGPFGQPPPHSDPLLSQAQSSCLDAHTSFAANTAAANVYKGNGSSWHGILLHLRAQESPKHQTVRITPTGVKDTPIFGLWGDLTRA
ncbi:hypothetical protein B0H14DRAFT_3134256 [Mycena olivaceomarginata]|nr:hypothetical protein B0H14DRAFT_3134256 [Mycena olivaceomarginata]